MQQYPVRPSHRANLTTERLEAAMGPYFEGISRNGEKVAGKYGAIAAIEVSAVGRKLLVEVRMDPKVPIEVAQETIRRYNRFLEETTGYSAKERAKRIKKAASASEE